MSQLKQAGPFLASLAFPKTCISCHREGAHLCEDRLAILPINEQVYLIPAPSPLDDLYAGYRTRNPWPRSLFIA